MTINGLWRSARVLLGRGGIDRELDEELRFHVEMAAERLQRTQGLDWAEARRRALVAFGGVDRFREEARDAWGLRRLEELTADLRYAARNLGRTPGSTAAAVLTLALGIGATAAAFTITSQLIRYSTPFAHADRLADVTMEDAAGTVRMAPPARVAWAWRGHARALDGVEPWGHAEFLQTGAGEATYLAGRRVTPTFLSFLGLAPALGRMFDAGEAVPGGPSVVVLGWTYWQSRFGGDVRIVGRTISLEGTPYTVVGVMPQALGRSDLGADVDLWVPLRPPRDTQTTNQILSVIARLRPGVPRSDAQRELDRIAAAAGGVGWGGRKWSAIVEPPRRAAGQEPQLLLLTAAMLLVLLVACANVAQLFLARAVGREAELAIRAALGAGRGRLVRQLLVEGLAVGVAAGALGAALAWAGLRVLLALRPDPLSFLDRTGPDVTVLAAGLALALLTPLLFALVPALQGTRGDLAARAGGGSTRAGVPRAHTRLRAGLIAAEVALSVVLLVPTGLLLRGLDRAARHDPGFQARGLVAARIHVPDGRYRTDAAAAQLAADLLARARTLPGVRAATFAGALPIDYWTQFGGLRVEGSSESKIPDSALLASAPVDAEFFGTLGIPLREGRGFTAEEVAANAPVVVVSEALARRLAPGRSALGLRVSDGDGRPWTTIVGIARDVLPLGRTSALEIYQPLAGPAMFRGPWLVLRTTGSTAAAAGQLRSVIRAVDRDLPVEQDASIESLMAAEYAAPRFATQVLALFAAIALLLAAIGLYGALSYTAGQRTREVGIRLALGAGAARVHRLVVRQGMVPALLGLAAGLGASLALARLLASMLYGTSPRDLPTLAAVSLTVSGVALAAAWLPARRATRVEPMTVLRAE